MFCGKCGKEMPDGANFCPACGAPAQGAAEEPPLETTPEPAEEPAREPAGEERPPSPGETGEKSIEEEIYQAIIPPEIAGEAEAESTGQDGAADGGQAGEKADQTAGETGEDAFQEPSESLAEETAAPGGKAAFLEKLKSQKKAILILAAVVVLAGAAWGIQHFLMDREYRADLQTAEACLETQDYEGAMEAYQAALEHKPGGAEASMGLARIHLLQGEYETAQGILASAKGRGKELETLRTVAALEPEVSTVDAGLFPVVEMELSCSGTPNLEEVQVLDEGRTCEVLESYADEGYMALRYQADLTDDLLDTRDVQLQLKVDDCILGVAARYDVPALAEARVQLVSTDVSAYPTVRAYFRVVDADTLDTIPNLTASAFWIRERLEGGEYLFREVHNATPMEGKYGLNIDLVADKSDSISDSDMAKIQQVMTEFIAGLHYQEGDQAEVLAFDSIVQQMCCYTRDQNLLVNGVNNMSTDGMTALYDALYMGVENAALQGGARCVIAFTDGYDNVSSRTSDEVIRHAIERQVPVYIIGVSSGVEEGELRRIASETGGRYWFIDDLYDMEEIFREIYAQQKKLYVVEYESDGEDPYAQRDLSVSLCGSGYYGTEESSFRPGRTVQGQTHGSRYELVKEPLTWEEARSRCQAMGGHLATITSQQEMDQLTKMADAQDVQFLWLGGYTSYDSEGNVFGHWITGESFGFESWAPDEPSRVDLDGVPEWYIMLWNVEKLGGWTWNDQRNDPAEAVKRMEPKMGFICEYES